MTLRDPSLLSPGAGQVVQDLVVDRGDLRVREGRSVYAKVNANLTAGPRTNQPFFVAGRSPVEHHQVAVIGTRIYWTMESAAIALWQANTAYAVGDQVLAVTRDAQDYVYECVTAGTSANPTEPTWVNTTPGTSTTTDNTVTWKVHRNPTAKRWKAGTAYAKGAIVRPTTANGYIYQCTTAGTSHAATEPTWPTTDAATVNDNGTVWECSHVPIYQEIDSTVTVHATNRIRLTQYADRLYVLDGDTYVRRLNTWGEFFTLQNFDAPTVAPTVTPTWQNKQLAMDGSVCLNSVNQGQYYGGGIWREPTSRNLTKWYITTPSGNPTSAEVASILPFSVATNAFPGTDDDLTPAQSASAGVTITAGTSPGTVMTVGDVLLKRRLTAAEVTDWTGVTALMFSLLFDTGSDTPLPASVEFGYTETTSADPAAASFTWFTVDVSGAVSVSADPTHPATGWAEATNRFTVDLSAITDDLKNSVTYIAFRFTGLAISQNGDGVAKLLFSPLELNISGADFEAATYYFTYSYGKADTDGDGLDEESPEYIGTDENNTYPSQTFNAAIPEAVTVTVAFDSGTTATYANVYAKGGTTSKFHKIGTVTSPATTLTWDGVYPANDVKILPQYVGRPPAGCTMAVVHRNRLVLVGANPADPTGPKDTLFFSNAGDPERVPIVPSSLMQVPASLGGWAETEKFGHSVTGLASYMDRIVAFKLRGVFALFGDPGAAGDAVNAFNPQAVSQTDGCSSHESIVQAEGALFFLDGAEVKTFDMDGIRPISTEIGPTVEAYSATQQQTSFAVYDPSTRRYLLFFPSSASLTATPAATALVYHFRPNARPWARWTQQPGSCAAYDPHASTPGIMLCDAYGTGGTGKAFLLDDTATTDANCSGAASSIPWQWVSGEVGLGDAYLDVDTALVRAYVADSTPDPAYNIALAIWPQNNSAGAVSQTATFTRVIASGTIGTATAEWWPAPRGEMESFAFKLARGTTDLIAIRGVTLTVSPRGLRTGRTT